MTKGPLELRRTYPDVGAIRVSSGTHKKLTLRALERMCAGLYDAGRLDYLRLIRDRAITPLALYDRIRGKDYRELARPVVQPLQTLIDGFLARMEREASGSHHKNLKSYLARIRGTAPKEATAADVPAAVRALRDIYQKADQAASFNRLRAAALAFLRDTVTRRAPEYADVLDIRTLRVIAKREPRPLTPREAFELAGTLGSELGPCWLTLCLTGMGRSEYAGRWAIEDGHLHIYGPKRARTRQCDAGQDAGPLPHTGQTVRRDAQRWGGIMTYVDGFTCTVCGCFIPSGMSHACGGIPTYPVTPIGWRCPACGAGNAPWLARCACVPVPPVPSTNTISTLGTLP